MSAHRDIFHVETRGRGTYDVTREVARIVEASRIPVGLATVFVHHTSASLLLNENADDEVRRDFERFLSRLVPDGDPIFRHVEEGPDDMPAHVRAALLATSVGLPVANGELDLGTWQGLYLYEHRHAPHRRRVSVTLVG